MEDHAPSILSHRPRVALLALVLAAGVGGALAAVVSGFTVRKPAATLGVAQNVRVASRTESIVVTSRGLTVYTLSGETVHHLKCTKANACLQFWFRVAVRGRTARPVAARGIRGTLGILHRDGVDQVTLAGRPLYSFRGDGTRRRSVAGQGIVSFGGTWKVVAIQTRSAGTTTSTSSTTATTSSSPSLGSGY